MANAQRGWPWRKTAVVDSKGHQLRSVILSLLIMVCHVPACMPHANINQTLFKPFEPLDSVTSLLRSLLDPEVYDSQLPPSPHSSPAVIKIDLFIKNIGPVQEDNMVFQMDCYFRQYWLDVRLAFANISDIDIIPLSLQVSDALWKPDTYFVNGRNSYLHTMTAPNKLLRIKNDGQVLYSMRLTVKARCPMVFRKYPVDVQSCPLYIGSYAYTSSEVIYEWGSTAAVFESAEVLELAQFTVLGFLADNYTLHRPGKGFESVLEIRFAMKRQIGFFLLQIYLPSYMMVVLSWMSFWFNREAVQERVCLGITTLLSCVTLSITVKEGLPQLEYSTALDVFLQMCFAFIFGSLIEFAGKFELLSCLAVNYFTIINPHGGEKTKPQSTLAAVKEPSSSVSKSCLSSLVKMSGKAEERSASARCDRKRDKWTLRNACSESEALAECDEGSEDDAKASPAGGPAHRHVPAWSTQIATSSLSQMFHLPIPAKPNCLRLFLFCLCGDLEYRRHKTLQKPPDHMNSTSRIDLLARVYFPVVFITLNVIYWIVLIYF